MKPIPSFVALVVVTASVALSLMSGCVASDGASSVFAADGLKARLRPEQAIALVRAFCVREKTPLSQFDEVRARFHRTKNGGSWTVSLYFADARKQEISLTHYMWFTVDDRSEEVRPMLQY